MAGRSIGKEVFSEISAVDGFGVEQDFEPIVYTQQQLGAYFESLFIGHGIPFRDDSGNRVIFYVLKMDRCSATFTINHPWAGKDLHFSAKVLNIRCATDKELAQGFPIEEEKGNRGSCSCC